MQHIVLTKQNQNQSVQEAAKVILGGGLVIYPTETMYGAAVDATNPVAVSKLLRFKRRPAGKAISVMVSNLADAEKLVEMSSRTKASLGQLLPGPLTAVCLYKTGVDDRLISELGSLGIRISSYPVAEALVKAVKRPITATSANPAGAARPYSSEQLLKQLSPSQRKEIDLILDAGPLPKREPSTVLDFTTPVQQILRSGMEIEKLARPYPTQNEEETQVIASQIVESLLHALREKPVVIALSGDLGMGKTQFAKGVAKSLGVQKMVTSPSYTLMKEYDGMVGNLSAKLLHLDCWRSPDLQAAELDLDSYLLPQHLLVIEWPAPLLAYLRSLGERAVVHHYQITSTPTGREISLIAL